MPGMGLDISGIMETCGVRERRKFSQRKKNKMKKRTYISIDGGYLNFIMKGAGFFLSADNIERIAHACVHTDSEELWRIMFYHCREYDGEIVLPVSGEKSHWRPKTNYMFDDLARKDFFAVRLGTLAFRGWHKKSVHKNNNLSDADFAPSFEQKGVDMRIGLDMASLAEQQRTDRLILITADTDLIPALKICRQRGIQIIAIEFPDRSISSRLKEHVDICRAIKWPDDMAFFQSRADKDKAGNEKPSSG